MIKKTVLAIVGVVVVLAAALLVVASRQPDHFQVQRSASIHAAPQAIYRHLEDFQAWSAWSPWEKLDPAMKRTFSGPASRPGASYAWEGNGDVGAGRMEIVEVSPPERLVIRLDFLKPFEAHNTITFDLKGEGDRTYVTWTMVGPSPLVSKVMGLFMSMDAMIGKDFEAGLANLKRVAEEGR